MSVIEQFVGLIDVQLAQLSARPLAVPVDHRRRIGRGRGAGAGEDYLGDRLTVDGHRNRLAYTHILVPRVVHREPQRGDVRAGPLQEGRSEFGPGVLVGGVGQIELNVQGTGLHIGVRGQALGVYPPDQALGLGLLRAGVLVVTAQREPDTTHPVAVGLEGAIADGVHAELGRIPIKGLGQRQERGVSQGHRVDSERGVEPDGECHVIHDVQSAHLGGPRRDLVLRISL